MKKKTKILFNFIDYLFNILDIIMQLTPYRLIFVREDRIGHQSGGFEVALIKAIRIRRSVHIVNIFIFYERSQEIANKYLRKLFIKELLNQKFRYVIFNEKSYFFRFIYFFINHRHLYKGGKNTRICEASTNVGRRVNKPIIHTSNNHGKLCKFLNINPENYVCIYARDNNYLESKYKNSNWDYHQYRNSDINNLKFLSEYISNQIGWDVVRIGSNPKEKIKWESSTKSRIVDYSFSRFQNDVNDIELISGCKLYISNGGGPESVAIAAGRDMIKINQAPLGGEEGYYFGPWIPKLYLNKTTKQFLSLLDICKLKIHNSYDSRVFEGNNISLIENTPDDIFNLFLDFLKYKNKSFTNEDLSIIDHFYRIKNRIFNEWEILRYRKNFIAPSFLKKHYHLLKE